MKNKDKIAPRIKIEVEGYSLQEVLDQLIQNNIKPKDYNKLRFVLDYHSCYYESDMPDMNLESSGTLS